MMPPTCQIFITPITGHEHLGITNLSLIMRIVDTLRFPQPQLNTFFKGPVS